MTAPSHGPVDSVDRGSGPGPRALAPEFEALLRGVSAPAAPAGLRARVLAAAERETPVLRPLAPSSGRRWLAAGVAAAAAAVVLVVGGATRAPARPAARWEALHPAVSTPPVRVRVVDDATPDALGAASIVSASFDPLEGP